MEKTFFRESFPHTPFKELSKRKKFWFTLCVQPSSAQNKKIPSPPFLKIFERWGSGGRKLSKKVFFPRNKKQKTKKGVQNEETAKKRAENPKIRKEKKL